MIGMEICLTQSQELALRCEPVIEVRLRMCLLLDCKVCGTINDISKFLEMRGEFGGDFLDAVPLCSGCGHELWNAVKSITTRDANA